MKPTPEMWTAINTLGLVALGVVTLIGNHLAARRQAKTLESLSEHGQKIDATLNDVREVKQVVNGPLTASMNQYAKLAVRMAELTKLPADQEAARSAVAVAANHEKGKP